MKIKEGDYVYIEWNGTEYLKKQHYHVVEVRKRDIIVRVPGSYIKLIIPVKAINKYEIKQLKEKFINIISLGAGKQSSYMLLTALEGKYEYKPDFAIFSDTGCEPQYVYDYLEWLKDYVKSKYDFDIIIVSGGNLMQDAIDYYKGNTKRGASLPFFTSNGGMIRRQCTGDYKIAPIKRYYQKIREGQRIRQWIGISLDEVQRVKDSSAKYIENYYPLIEKRITISEIVKWFEKTGINTPGKSSCLICPFHSDNYWMRFKKEYPEEFEKACQFDEQIRNHPSLDNQCYLHRSLKPLREINFKYEPSLFPELIEECDGMCGL